MPQMCASFFKRFFFQSCLWGGDHHRQPAYLQWDGHSARQIYSPIKLLGKGAFSQIFLAKNLETGQYAALKVIFLNSPQLHNSDETKHLLLQEAELLRQLKHPNLVRCYDVIPGDNALVLVLELLRGGNILDRLFALSDVYSEKDAAGVFCQLAAAVEYLHSQNILHRDIKPENLMYARPPDPKKPVPIVKLVDLGLAHIYDPQVPEKGVLGSAGFVAPEIIRGGVHSPAMDVYAMGVLLFIMLVGRKPFNNTENENLRYCFLKLHDAPGLKDPRWLDLSPDAKYLLMGMLAFDPERRLTAKQVAQHEWVVSEGGLAHRPLGQDVALAAAAVADLRRLRNMCGGGIALKRVLEAAADLQDTSTKRLPNTKTKTIFEGSQPKSSGHSNGLESSKLVDIRAETPEDQGGSSPFKGLSTALSTSTRTDASPNSTGSGTGFDLSRRETAEHLAYLEQRKEIVDAENRVYFQNNNPGGFKSLARKIAAKSFIHIHDSSIRKGSTHGGSLLYPSHTTASGNLSNNNNPSVKGGGVAGLRRSATAVLLSDLVASTDGSVRGSHAVHVTHKVDRSVSGGQAAAAAGLFEISKGGTGMKSGISMLAASVVHLVDTSMKKGRGKKYQYTPSVESSLHGGQDVLHRASVENARLAAAGGGDDL